MLYILLLSGTFSYNVAIYSSILQNPQINAEFLEQNKLDELKEIKQKLWRFVNIDNRWNTSEEDKKKKKI